MLWRWQQIRWTTSPRHTAEKFNERPWGGHEGQWDHPCGAVAFQCQHRWGSGVNDWWWGRCFEATCPSIVLLRICWRNVRDFMNKNFAKEAKDPVWVKEDDKEEFDGDWGALNPWVAIWVPGGWRPLPPWRIHDMALWVVVALTWRMRRPALWQSRPGVVYFALPVILRSNLYEQQVHLFLGLKVIAIGCFKINDSYDGNRRTSVVSGLCWHLVSSSLFWVAGGGVPKSSARAAKLLKGWFAPFGAHKVLTCDRGVHNRWWLYKIHSVFMGCSLREIGLKAP